MVWIGAPKKDSPEIIEMLNEAPASLHGNSLMSPAP
jgi:hypothetical protein